jgi:uncharacterized protein (DUF342 family)
MENNRGTTIKEYARSRGITHEAVRRQLKRYSDELEGHITIHGRTKYLDSAAVDFLDQHRLKTEVTVEVSDTMAKQEIDKLKEELDLYQDKVTALQDMIISLQQEKMELVEYRAKSTLLLEQKEKDQAELEQTKSNLDAVKEELAAAKTEIDSFKPSLFGFYRKK